jgi:hypothetical protein
VGTDAACLAPAQVDGLVFALDAACQDWAMAGRGGAASAAQWATLAGDAQLGISTEGLQYDAKEGHGSYLFDSVVQPVDLDISPSQYPALTIELWVRVNSFAGTSNGWIIGHDDGGFDRGVCLHDPRYGGIAGPNGGVYASTLGPPEIGQWTHVVATFQTGVDSKVFRNDRANHLQDSRVTSNDGGEPQFTIGGLANYGNHHIDSYVAEVRVYERVLSYEDVMERYEATCARYHACS